MVFVRGAGLSSPTLQKSVMSTTFLLRVQRYFFLRPPFFVERRVVLPFS